MNSYQLYKKWFLLVLDQSKGNKQTNNSNEPIEMHEWNDFSTQMKPTETYYSYKVRMKFYVKN